MRHPSNRVRTALLVLAGSAAACRGFQTKDVEPTDTVTDTVVDTGTTDPDRFHPELFSVTAVTFAIDDQGRAVSYTDDGVTIPVTLEVILADATGATGMSAENSCTVTLVHPGPIEVAAWSAESSAYAAFEVPSDATSFTDCERFEFPPAWSGGVVEAITSWRWGFGAGPVDAAVRTNLAYQMGAGFAAIEPYLIGGGYYWNGLLDDSLPFESWNDGWVDTSVIFAYEVDAGAKRYEDGYPVPVLASTVGSGSDLPAAIYEVQGTTVLAPAGLLLTP